MGAHSVSVVTELLAMHSLIFGPRASASPGSLLELQELGTPPRIRIETALKQESQVVCRHFQVGEVQVYRVKKGHFEDGETKNGRWSGMSGCGW